MSFSNNYQSFDDAVRDAIKALPDPEEARDMQRADAAAYAAAAKPGARASGLKRAPAEGANVLNVAAAKRPPPIDISSDTDEDEKEEAEPDYGEDVQDILSNPLDDGKLRRRLMAMTLSLHSATKKQMAKFLAWLEEQCDVLVYQTERGKEGAEQGYEHIQLCCRFRKQTLFSTVRIQMHPIKGWTRGIEGVDGLARMVNYCTKEDTRIDGPHLDKGKEAVLKEGKGKSGTRTDLLKFRKFMIENPTITADEVPEEHLSAYARYGRLADQLRINKQVKVPFKRAYCLHGKSGVGKTARAKMMAAELGMSYFVKNSSNQWWDGYMGQDCVIVEEVRAGQAGQDSKKILCEFLQLLDPEDAYLAQIKGGFVYIRAKLFIFTSPVHPSQWFHCTDFEDDPAAQLVRRFTKITELKDQFQHPKAQEPEPVEASKWDELAEVLFKDA